MRKGASLLAALAMLAQAQTRVEYVGGTAPQVAAGMQGSIALADDRYLAFYAGKIQMRVAYDRVNLVEYGQQVDRRLALAFSDHWLQRRRRQAAGAGVSGRQEQYSIHAGRAGSAYRAESPISG
jgi:hypothetical protein